MEWRNSGQGKNQWPDFVNTVMNFQVLDKTTVSWPAEQILYSGERIFFIDMIGYKFS